MASIPAPVVELKVVPPGAPPLHGAVDRARAVLTHAYPVKECLKAAWPQFNFVFDKPTASWSTPLKGPATLEELAVRALRPARPHSLVQRSG